MKVRIHFMGKIRSLPTSVSGVVAKARRAATHTAAAAAAVFISPMSLIQFKPLLIFLSIVLVSCVCAAKQASGQSGPAAAAVNEITPLKIGDKVPDELWKMHFPIVSAGKDQVQYVSLQEFRGKVIILDLWTTWCSVCIAGMPKMFSYQQLFDEDVMVLPVTVQDEKTVVPFVKRNTTLNALDTFYSVIDGELIHKFFPSEGYPNIGIIGRDGRVVANVRPPYLNEDKIQRLIRNEQDVYFPFTRGRKEIMGNPLLSLRFTDLKKHKPIYYSTLMGEMDGLSTQMIHEIDSLNETQRWFFQQQDFLNLYAQGYRALKEKDIGFERFPNRRILEVKNPQQYIAKYGKYSLEPEKRIDYEREYYYTYEVVAPKGLRMESLGKKLLYDLNSFFDVEGRIEKREMDCLVLRKIDGFVSPNNVEIKERMEVSSIVQLLNHRDFKLKPVLDGVGDTKWIKLEVDYEKTDFGYIESTLRKHGLELVPESREIEMFILTEPGFERKANKEVELTAYGYVPKH